MRYFSFLILIFISVTFFPSLSIAIGTCDYARQVIPPLNIPGGQVTDYDYSYGYASVTEAREACWSAIENDNACMAYSQGGYETVRAFQDGTVYIYVVCDNCRDTCPTDDTCDTCEQIAQCDCADSGGYVMDNLDMCLYHCREDGDPDPCVQEAVQACGGTEQLKSVGEDANGECVWECKDHECQDEYDAALLECSDPYLVDSLTCEYSCGCSAQRADAEAACTEGYFLRSDTCEWSCKGCDDKFSDCVEKCNGSDNIDYYNCKDYTPAVGPTTVESGTYVCKCVVPPPEDPPPPGSNPTPDPNYPDPDPDTPDDPPTCADANAACSSDCQFTCWIDSSGVIHDNCDCGDDPEDPNNPGEPADDGTNGWLKAIEENTDRTANGVADGNKLLKSIESNTRESKENDKKYFVDSEGRSVFKDSTGKSYLQTIAGKDFSPDVDVNVAAPEVTVDIPDEISTTGSGTVPSPNEYSSTFTEGEGFTPVSDPDGVDGFSQGLSDYISTGIPLVSWLEGSTMNLSSASPTLNFTFFGNSFSVDFSQYQSIIDIMGNLLFGLTILSSLMLIITRVKG